MAAPGNGAEDDKIQNFINKDMKDHPRCRYSLSSQKECSSTNGNFSCETIRRVFRNCPGMRPEQVYDITTRDTGTVPKPPRGGDGSDGGIPAFGGRASQKPRGGSPFVVPPDDWPSGGKGMDDLLGTLQDRMNNFFKESPFPFPEPDADQNHGGGGGGGGGARVAEPAWKSTTPHVPPPHKVQRSQSKARGGEKRSGAGEATKDDSVVARA